MRNVLSGALLLPLILPCVFAVKAGDFKTCSQAAFCRRGRALAGRAQENQANWRSPYSVDASSIAISPDQASFTAAVKSELYPDVKFKLDVRVHDNGVVRVRMDERDGLFKRYDEAASWALVKEPEISSSIRWTAGKKDVKAVYGEKKEQVEIIVEFAPLVVRMKWNGKEQVLLNGNGLLHMEHFRKKEDKKDEDISEMDGVQKVMETNVRAWFEGDTEDGLWEETFKTWTDSKPKGPESLSLDITFPNHGHVYGIPQHATNLDLPTTSGKDAFFEEPYRLYNADVFEYLASSPMSLYGSIPLMHAHSADSTVAVFDAVASETWIDLDHPTSKSTSTHWISESGILDVFILPGPTPEKVFAQYAELTGAVELPAHWSLGYHQCRWNYVSSEDVRTVQERFDEEDIPVDVFWLDIEYSQDHKYMIWDKRYFPDPIEMTNDVEALGRKMVVIVDPHLKRVDDYPVYKQASELGVLVKPSSGSGEFEGWCWSGSSSWIDFFNPSSWDWWKSLFKFVPQNNQWTWTESSGAIHIWNDMNEPAIFNGPEITMPKDSIHYGGWEHRDVHNVNGMLFSNLTAQGVKERTNPQKRPFVLTRSFYSGTQRYAAMWTGDNMGTWEHMAVGVKMVLANGIGGMSFAGSDVGGFFGNPDNEMLVRWYHVGAFSPFFRAHAHIDTKRREPFLLDEPYKSIVRDILKLRYSMLPIWYTAFRESSITGLPVVRPHFVVFPQDETGFSLDQQYFIGSSGLLVKPITEPGVTESWVYLPEDQVYYDYFSDHAYRGSTKGVSVTVPAPLERVPLLIRGGSIIPTRERPRRSSPLMKQDPFTLKVALSQTGSARGELYLDDGENYEHHKGNIVWREFAAVSQKKTVKISSTDLATTNPSTAVNGVALTAYNGANDFAASIAGVRVEKVVVLGLKSKPKTVTLDSGAELVWDFISGISASDKKEGMSSKLIIRDPGVGITRDWAIIIDI